MPQPAKPSWSETDVSGLIGQSESIRREFKSGRLFDSDESKWAEVLSKEVSALSNTEGGELFLGVAEGKSKPKVAEAVDGVSDKITSERLQQLIEGNVSPYLPGIRVHRVRLSAPSDRAVFVIQIPQGNTAYQAKDGRYYGRSEFEAKHLPDHEIRLRMSRGKVARGLVSVRLLKTELGIDEERRIKKQHAKAIDNFKQEPRSASDQIFEVMQAEFIPDKFTFQFLFKNDGEITIRAPVIEFLEKRSGSFTDDHLSAKLPTRVNMDQTFVYPGDEQVINESEYWLECKRDMIFAPDDYMVRWKIFLDNSPPSAGEIDLGTLIQSARTVDGR